MKTVEGGTGPIPPEEVEGTAAYPEVVRAAEARGVEEVLHFTTRPGALGILAVRAVRNRLQLREDQYLEHVYRRNAEFRRDGAWLGYVNLSISRINDWMYESSVAWHPDLVGSWVVFSFTPRLLGDPGIVFATTNNIYPACKRGEGLEGFTSLFADVVLGRYGARHDRVGKRPEWPTDRQAEVLYPGELSCTYLQRIDVQSDEALEAVVAAVAVLGHKVPVRVAPEAFE